MWTRVRERKVSVVSALVPRVLGPVSWRLAGCPSELQCGRVRWLRDVSHRRRGPRERLQIRREMRGSGSRACRFTVPLSIRVRFAYFCLFFYYPFYDCHDAILIASYVMYLTPTPWPLFMKKRIIARMRFCRVIKC